MAKKVLGALANLPFSKAVLNDGKYLMEVSGQVGIDPSTGKLAEGIGDQTKYAMNSIKKILEEIGWGLENIVKTRIFLTDMENYSRVNEIYSRYFSKDYPARVALAVKGLPLGALVEIECTASGNLSE